MSNNNTRNARKHQSKQGRTKQGNEAEPMEIDTTTEDEVQVTDSNPSVATAINASDKQNKKASSRSNTTNTTTKQQRTGDNQSKQNGWTVVRNPYKKVQSTSANRRLCSRGPSSLQLEATPDRTNRVLGNFNHRTRVTVKLNIEASDDPKEAILNALNDFFEELTNADGGSALLPWKRSEFAKGKVDGNSAFPTDFSRMKVYVPRLFAGKKDEKMTIYPNLFIGHALSFQEIRKKVQPWLSNANNGLFRNMLQAENTSEIGFFLYSCREMDAGALADEIHDVCGFSVGLRWKTINNGKRNIPVKQQVKALIVEVDAKYRHKYQKALVQFYRRTTRDIHEYPNGIRLRFVKSWDDAINTTEKKKIEKLRLRQKDFLANIRTTCTYDILDLDSSVDRDETLPTLRQMIMSIRSGENNAVPLFHSVDLDYTGSGYTFIYSNNVAMEAECVINTLVPYILHFFPETENYIERMFDDDAVERCEYLKYDSATNQVVDTQAGDIIDIEVGDELEGFSFQQADGRNAESDSDSSSDDRTKTKVGKKQASASKKRIRPEDDDSISTFGGRSKASTLQSPPRLKSARMHSRHDETSVMSGISSATMETIKTLQVETEQKFSILQKENEAIKQQNSRLHSQMDRICQLLEGNQSKTSAQSVEASQPPDSDSTAGEKQNTSSGPGLQ